MSGWRRFAFALLMVALTGVFIGLGVWQWNRLAEKEALIATVTERLDDPPVLLPPPDAWGALDPADYDYLPVQVTGRFVADVSVLVFTSLANARGERSGPGYWVMTPFALEGGGTVLLNRGFIPQAASADLAAFEPMNPAAAPLTIAGIARAPERAGGFTPAPDRTNGIDWVRDPPRLAVLAGDLPQPLLPLYVDLPAGGPGTLPQGGETVVDFPNNHLGYALTWFGFALLTPIMLFFWLWRQRPSRSA